MVGDLSAAVDISTSATEGPSDDVTLLHVIVELAAGVLSTSESLSTILILRRGVESFVEVDDIESAATTAGASDGGVGRIVEVGTGACALAPLVMACCAPASVDARGGVRNCLMSWRSVIVHHIASCNVHFFPAAACWLLLLHAATNSLPLLAAVCYWLAAD